MATNNEAPERKALREKRDRSRRYYETLLNQGSNTKGVFSGPQLSGEMSALPSQIAKAKSAWDVAQVALDQYDAEHPI